MVDDDSTESYQEMENDDEQEETLTNSGSGSPIMYQAENREDMFVDASEELNYDTPNKEGGVSVDRRKTEEGGIRGSHSREMGGDGEVDQELRNELESLKALMEKTVEEKVNTEREYKEEREILGKELYDLREQFGALTDTGPYEDGDRVVSGSLHEMVSQCSKLLESMKEERTQHDSTVRELQGFLSAKDQEIEDLNSKVRELSVSDSDHQLGINQHIKLFADRTVASLAIVFSKEDLPDNSIIGKLKHVENCVPLLIERYNQIELSVGQLRQCLSNVSDTDFNAQEVIGNAVDELLVLKKKDAELAENINHLEEENKKFVEKVDADKQKIEALSTELAKMTTDYEHEKSRCANTKEKLSMAVTKGKALVQQRDALKKSLAEKTSELEKCLIDLQEKTSVQEAAEISKGQLEQLLAEKTSELEKCLIELQEKTSVQEADEISKGQLEQLLAEKTSELEKCLIELQEKTSVQEAAEISKGQLEHLLSEKTDELEKVLVELREKSAALDASEVTNEKLEQSLVEKRNEVENCLTQLQDKSGALKDSELCKEELIKYETSVASLQEMLSQNNLVIENFERVLSLTDVPEELQSKDIVHRLNWLVEWRNELKGVLQENNRFKEAVCVRLMNLPEGVSDLDLESRLDWLRESFDQAKNEINMLQYQIERLSASLSLEIQEKDYIQSDLDDLIHVHKDVVEKSHHSSTEKDKIVRILLESSGMTREEQEEVYQTSPETAVLISRCFERVSEQTCPSLETSTTDSELFEKIQSLLYVKEQELMLHKELQGEDLLLKSQIDDLSNELRATSQELAAFRGEKDSLLKDLERSEEKSAMVREKLSMAVKKGKGLVQDRENLKRQLDGKNTEIQDLKLQAQQLESKVEELNGKINEVSEDLEKIPKLEADLAALEGQRDQLELFLSESNSMLQKVIQSVDSIVLPVNSVSNDLVEKVNQVAGYLSECQLAKMHSEQELREVKEEATNLASKLAETQETGKSLENALLAAENSVSQLSEEKREAEASKKYFEEELQKALDESYAAKRAFEDALAQAEDRVSELIGGKEEAQAVSVLELEKIKTEVADQTNQLSAAYNTIKSLENALSQAEANVAVLTKQNNDVEVEKNVLENELKELKDETDLHASKVADSFMTIKSLEDALLEAKNSLSLLEEEKTNADEEVSVLSSKLNRCMEELAGTRDSLESKSPEIIDCVTNLRVLLKDETLYSKMNQFFERKFKSLKDMDSIVREIGDYITKDRLVASDGDNVFEENSSVTKPFLNGSNDLWSFEENDLLNKTEDIDTFSLLQETSEAIRTRDKSLTDKFEGYSSSVDELIGALLKRLQITRDAMFDHVETLQQKVDNMKTNEQEREKAVAILENDVIVLVSACQKAVKELQFEVKNNLSELCDIPDLQFLDEQNVEKQQQRVDDNKYIQAAEELSSATRKVQTMIKWFDTTSHVAVGVIEDLKNKLRESSIAFEKSVEERDLNQSRVSLLEADVEALQASYRELRLALEKFQEKEEKWHEKEAELSSSYNSLLLKGREVEDHLMSASQIRTLFDKINGIDIPIAEPVRGLEQQSSASADKLFYIIDSVSEMQHQMDLLSYEKEELQSNLSTKTLEAEQLKKEVEEQVINNQDSEDLKTELSELVFGLEKTIDRLGGSSFVGDRKFADTRELLPALEKQVMARLLESENSKSKAQELDRKLTASQKAVNELSTKVKTLEGTLQNRNGLPEIVQERNIELSSLPSASEITEIQDVGTSNNSINPASTAAHVRTLRKGSSDHLAINIDSESERLIKNAETDEDKGHPFKSLSTSGLIPKQGKIFADRIDGIWVNGGRVLMSRPRARLGVIAYCLFLHLLLLGIIL